MVNKEAGTRILTALISFAWLINGLFCKVLNLIPRHRQIVSEILGHDYASLLTITIGVFEIFMAVWVLSRFRHRLCTAMQILLVATMNILEFIIVPDLLLFGRLNIVVAAAFILVLIIHERKQTTAPVNTFTA